MRTLALVLLLAACSAPEPDADSSSSSSSSTGEGATTTTGEPCPVGALGCACTPGGFCDAALVCEAGVCAEGCAVGSLDCACTEGGGCDGGLACEAGTCIEGMSPPCSESQPMDDCCGDGWLDDHEECDAGDDNADDAACTSTCKLAVCGDGLVGPGEACDGGENCSDACTLTTCGNGTIDPGEHCEPTGADDPECTALCTDARKVIFVSSEHYRGGEIGGISGGDAKCQSLADAAGLGGEFKVWLATSKDDAPLVRFAWFDGPYVDVNGQQIADTWSEIYKTENDPPRVDERGGPASPSNLTHPSPPTTSLCAWASAIDNVGGPATDKASCGGWADIDAVGAAARLDDESQHGGTFWAAWGGAPCDAAAPLICVEQ